MTRYIIVLAHIVSMKQYVTYTYVCKSKMILAKKLTMSVKKLKMCNVHTELPTVVSRPRHFALSIKIQYIIPRWDDLIVSRFSF